MPELPVDGAEGPNAESLYDRLLAKSKQRHQRTPVLRNLPLPAIAIVGLVGLVNVIAWIGAAITLVSSGHCLVIVVADQS